MARNWHRAWLRVNSRTVDAHHARQERFKGAVMFIAHELQNRLQDLRENASLQATRANHNVSDGAH